MRLPISASHTLYSRREAEAGSTSNSVIGRPSKSEMLLTGYRSVYGETTKWAPEASVFI
jgi:hypothetical protein